MRRLCQVVYNVLSFCQSYRLHEFSRALSRTDVVVPQRTRCRASEHETSPVHTMYHFGYSQGSWTNASTGVSILLRRFPFGAATPRRVDTPPAPLASRGGPITIRRNIMVLAVFWPARHCRKRQQHQPGKPRSRIWPT